MLFTVPHAHQNTCPGARRNQSINSSSDSLDSLFFGAPAKSGSQYDFVDHPPTNAHRKSDEE